MSLPFIVKHTTDFAGIPGISWTVEYEQGTTLFNGIETDNAVIAGLILTTLRTKAVQYIQQEIKHWANSNFGSKRISKHDGSVQGSLQPLMGIGEEFGELLHATLKRHQGIRGFDDPAKYAKARNDAVADIAVYLLDYCNQEDIDFLEVLSETWNRVKQRDWEKNKVDADKVVEAQQ